ncbi:hypothetical protein AB0K80_06230 [Streptomyces sp. NPDC052682]|uniref:hypothetical protein n=1 Tax=Streptomyces sp. NPDC052682 TaxID=3154954 RepID=UPI00343583F9
MTHQPPPYGGPPSPYGQQLPPVPPAPGPQGFGPPPPQYAPAPPPPPAAPQAAGPDFLAVDRRNSVVVDAAGVAFENDGVSLEFAWQEIRSIHYRTSPSGKHLMMAVVHLDGRFYECVVEAKPRSRLGEWCAQLAPVLGYYRPMGW